MDAGPMAVWRAAPIEPGQQLRRQTGPLTLWIERTDKEWHLAAHRRAEADEEPQAAEPAVPDAPEWRRWAAGDEANVVQLVPAMPDRPVVARPETAFSVPPGREALLFVTVPVWARVTVGERREVELCEEPTVVLSNTWFGDPMSGELCYSLQTRARRVVAESQARAHRAVCPVRVRNAAAEQLPIERLCLRVGHLTVYEGKAQLWTNQVDVTFRGEDQPSQVEYARKPPTVEAVGPALGEPRTPPTSSLLQRSFAGLKSLTGI